MKHLFITNKHGRVTLLVSIVSLAALLAIPIVASAASQSFSVLNNQAQPGMLMSLTTNSGVVEPANDKNAASLVGVLAADPASLSQQPSQTSVATDGQVSALVSTLGGDIKVGDHIGTSLLNGVGAKLTDSGWMVGVAESSLDAKTAGAVATNLTDTAGHKHAVYVARIPLIVKVNYFAVPVTTTHVSGLQALADRIAGKRASTLALVLSFVLLVTGIVWAGLVLYAAVRGSLDAVGRQPLSKVVINRVLFKSFGVVLAVMAGVLIGAFLLLRIL